MALIEGFGKLAKKLRIPASTARRKLKGRLEVHDAVVQQGKVVYRYTQAQLKRARALLRKG